MKRLLLVFAGCIVTSALSRGTDLESDRLTLKGLSGIYVVVDLSSDAVDAGLTDDSMRADVELKLRLAGIRVMTSQESMQAPGQPFLSVVLNTQTRDKAFYYFSITLDLNQRIMLVRDPRMEGTGVTWSRSWISSVGRNNFAEGVRSQVKDATDSFINAWLAVNPKR